MKFLLFALPVAIILVAGCIQVPVTGEGLIIEVFEPDFLQVYSGEPVNFRLLVKNMGSVDATDVKPIITGVDNWRSAGGTCDEWRSISASVPYLGIEGGSQNCVWTLEAPEVPEGLSTTHNPIVRLYYAYRTSVVKTVFIASRRELKVIEDSGKALPAETKSSTSGPITMDIKSIGPIRFWESSVAFPLEITVNNMGGGVVCPTVSDCENGQRWNSMKLDIEGEEIIISECKLDEVSLWRGKSNTFVCDVTVSGLSDVSSIMKTISIEATYGYFIDKTTSVTVSWREAGFGF